MFTKLLNHFRRMWIEWEDRCALSWIDTETDFDELRFAWIEGKQLQYWQTLTYDPAWTDYKRMNCPAFRDTRWLWRIKPE